MYRVDPNNNPLVEPLLFVIGLPYLVPFAGWVWFGIFAFNAYKLPWWIVTPVVMWSIICSRAVPESKNLIKKDIDEQYGWITTKQQWGMVGLALLQYPTFIAAIYVLFA